AGQGTDTLRILIAAAGGSFTLAAHVENALLLNTVAFNLTGNDLANTLTGNAAANTLDGGGGADLLDGKGGADRLIGGLGNDTYVVDHGGDVVVENSGEGTDTVAVAIATTGSHTLADQVENGVLINGVAFHLYGNGLANTLTGNAAGNTLVGGAGADVLDGAGSADVLRGGADEDLYRVDLTSGNLQQDAVVELAGEGSDTIVLRGGNASLTSFATLTLAAEVENLDASGTGSARLHLTGNALANTLTGNGAGNTLNGAAGADVLIGGAGDDAYVVDDVGDQIVEDPGAGADQVILSILAAGASYVLADNVETVRMTSAVGLTLVGNDSANTLYGGLGDDYLIGNDGNDRLYADGGSDAAPGVGSGDILEGGLGDDVYFGVGVGVQVIEAVGEGWDSVYLAYSNGPTLIDLASDFQNVESLSLINATGVTRVVGTAAAERLEGNSAANTLEGNGGNDTLLGGGGQDVLIGGTGDDYYDIDSLDDIIIEDPGGGQDFVHVSRGNTTATPWNLAYSDVEAVDLGGAAGAINLTGGSEANTFYGNASANVLSGGAGNDTLTGGAGNDTLDGGNDDDVLYGGTGLDRLTGGSGADSFHFNAPLLAANLKTLTDFSAGTDTLVFEALGIAGLPASYDESMFQSAANHVASSLAVRFLYDSALGNLYYDADGSAAAKSAVLFAHLDGNPALSATDITIV
ncbi:MAG: calcium-binding protein, partial [Dechloromonas sp.]|nr:calcium-binding protein [Dechloromonas sp.]